ncbi:hypothetical protein A4X13_0g5190 [Tilletia indica]|uniref:Uncharacterized protein n=1 Tax=Tilletia indica TaxID=43049 RepID=A0A177TNN3_9BASI|nr:hypothetical protein A4X13_0g5190 [Tilletia indica]
MSSRSSISDSPLPTQVPTGSTYKAGSKLIVLAVYVDDVLIFSKDLSAIVLLGYGLAKRFKMPDQGEVRHFLGMEIKRNPEGKDLPSPNQPTFDQCLVASRYRT